MSQLPTAIRKAAVLISALDDRTADALLDQMDAETATRVRNAVMQIGEVPAAEQQAVLAQFLRSQSPSLPPAGDQGVELAASLVEQFDRPLPSASSTTNDTPQRPFGFLRNVAPRETSRVLAREQRQTIAVVIAQLDADLAAQVLEHLPAEQATDVLESLAWLEEPAAEVLADIERQLQSELSPLMTPGANRSSALANVQALVAAMDRSARERVLSGLGQRNSALARKLGYARPAGGQADYAVTSLRYRIEQPPHQPAPLFEFDDLLALADDALRRVLAAADPQIALLALTGADEPLVERILGQLPPRDAATLRRRLNHPGALRLSDIQAAQEQLAELARHLAEQGAIVLSTSRHFAAAA